LRGKKRKDKMRSWEGRGKEKKIEKCGVYGVSV